MAGMFATDYESILEKISQVEPIQYGKSRNFIDGAVTYLSPYLSRGVISTKQVLDSVLDKGYPLPAIASLAKELCWRDYFQRVAQHRDVNLDLRQKQTPVCNHGISVSILNAETGIQGIDQAIDQLYQTGYMHNHCRMYIASLACNLALSHWKVPALWMYYHLLDGDWASNACNWQWVAGANSAKKYFANQENINKYTRTNQRNTFLDVTYEVLDQLKLPEALSNTNKFVSNTILPAAPALKLNVHLPTFIYNYYNLDPTWHLGEQGNRILLIEPDFFDTYPVSKKCMDFMLALSKNIEGIQVYVGSFNSFIEQWPVKTIYFKEHPFNKHYKGIQESRDWIAGGITEYYPSFFAYWKKVERHLKNQI